MGQGRGGLRCGPGSVRNFVFEAGIEGARSFGTPRWFSSCHGRDETLAGARSASIGAVTWIDGAGEDGGITAGWCAGGVVA